MKISSKEKIIFLASFIVKLAMFLLMVYFMGDKGFFSSGDSYEYVNLAKNLTDHGAFAASWDPLIYEVTSVPGYPLFLSILLSIFSSFKIIVLLQIVLVSISAVWLYRILQGIFEERVRYSAALLYAIEPWNAFATNFILSEAVFMFFFVWSLYLARRAWDKNSRLYWLGSGILFSFAAIVRPIVIYLAPILAVIIFAAYFKDKKRGLFLSISFLVGFASLVLPWTIRNYDIFGVPIFSNKGPVTLFGTDLPQFMIYRDKINETQAGKQIEEMARADYPELKTMSDLNNPRYSSYLTNRSVSIMLQSPGVLFRMHALSFVTFFGSDGYRLIFQHFGIGSAPLPNITKLVFSGDLSGLLRYISQGGIYAASLIFGSLFWLMISLLAFGSFFVAYLRENNALTRGAVYIFIIIMLYFAVVTGIAAQARYRVPVTPFLFPLFFYTYYFLRSKYSHAK